jgi:hypothetical protein
VQQKTATRQLRPEQHYHRLTPGHKILQDDISITRNNFTEAIFLGNLETKTWRPHKTFQFDSGN